MIIKRENTGVKFLADILEFISEIIIQNLNYELVKWVIEILKITKYFKSLRMRQK